MAVKKASGSWRVLIASSHPLFSEGLRSLLDRQKDPEAVVVGSVSTIEEAVAALQALRPDLVIVDYDDERVNREEFLARFVEGEGRLRVVLLSLSEGGNEAIVYDRRTLAASQIEDWLEKWQETPITSVPPAREGIIGGRERNYRKRRDNMKHIIAAGLVVIALMAAGFWGLGQINLLPVQASLQAQAIDSLFGLHFSAIIVLFSLIVGLMIYSIIVFRRRAGDQTDAPHIEGSTPLEVAWTVVPLAAVLFVAYAGSITLGETLRADPRPLEVNVIGSQWAWRIEYPELGINSTELILPENKQTLLHLSSTDVIHSFWVPEFRVKQDALPGGDEFVRDLRVTPNKVGEYKIRCAELCGRLHHEMQTPVQVLSQADFDAWVQSQTAAVSDDPVVRGDQWTQQFGCRACHSIDGTVVVGPSWKGLFGSEETLADGTVVTVNHDYVVESIQQPGLKITAGFQNLMPSNIGQDLTGGQIEDIIAFIESLN
jgi:cytochrome c oxidase subunit 2